MTRRPPPDYPPGHGLLAGKTVLVTAAAGTGIGFATAKRCVEEGARVVISDIHERRLGEAADAARPSAGAGRSPSCNVTVEDDVQALFAGAVDRARRPRRAREQRRASAAPRRSST